MGGITHLLPSHTLSLGGLRRAVLEGGGGPCERLTAHADEKDAAHEAQAVAVGAAPARGEVGWLCGVPPEQQLLIGSEDSEYVSGAATAAWGTLGPGGWGARRGRRLTRPLGPILTHEEELDMA